MFFSKLTLSLQEPLVLIGFSLFLFLSFVRYLIKHGVIPRLSPKSGYAILNKTINYGFVLALFIVLLGFTLKFISIKDEPEKKDIQNLTQQLEHFSGAMPEYKKISDLGKKDFSVTTYLYNTGEKTHFSLTIALQTMHPKTLKEIVEYGYFIEFPDGTEMKRIGSSINFGGTNLEVKLDYLPAELKLRVGRTKSETIAGPFIYDLSHMQNTAQIKIAERAKREIQLQENKYRHEREQIENGRILYCKNIPYTPVGASICELELSRIDREYFFSVLNSLEIKSINDNSYIAINFKNNLIDPDNNKIGFSVQKHNKQSFLIALYTGEIEYRFQYKDGSYTKPRTVWKNPTDSDLNSSIYRLHAKDKSAPPAYIFMQNNTNYYNGQGTVYFVPFSPKGVMNAWWSIYPGGRNDFTKDKHTGFLVGRLIQSSQIGLKSFFDGKEPPNIQITYTYNDKTISKFTYQPNWGEWVRATIERNINFDGLISCQKYRPGSFGTFLYATCSFGSPGPVDMLFENIFWGETHKVNNQLFEFDYDNLIRSFNDHLFSDFPLAKYQELVDLKKHNGSSLAEYHNLKPKYENLNHQLESFKKYVSKTNPRQIKRGNVSQRYTVLYFTRPIDAVYFKFKLKSGKESPIVRKVL